VETRWAHDPESVVRPSPPRVLLLKDWAIFIRIASHLTSIKTALADKRIIHTILQEVGASTENKRENAGVLREIFNLLAGAAS
jgi:hypothetical protein